MISGICVRMSARDVECSSRQVCSISLVCFYVFIGCCDLIFQRITLAMPALSTKTTMARRVTTSTTRSTTRSLVPTPPSACGPAVAAPTKRPPDAMRDRTPARK
jgi:hypothetical protein